MTETDWDQLLTGYLDNELTQQDRQRVEQRMINEPTYRAQFDDLTSLQTDIAGLDFQPNKTTQWSELAPDVTSQTTRSLGWLTYIISTLFLIGYGLYEFIIDETENAFVKTAVLGIFLGLGLLLISVIKQRLVESRTDRYKDVQI
jgi:hypothetical protein